MGYHPLTAFHARAYYGISDGGFADLAVQTAFSYQGGNGASVGISLHGSTLLDGDKSDALDRAGVDADSAWLQLMVGRRF